MSYHVTVSPNAILDIQLAIDYYDDQQLGLGLKFEAYLNEYILGLEKKCLLPNSIR